LHKRPSIDWACDTSQKGTLQIRQRTTSRPRLDVLPYSVPAISKPSPTPAPPQLAPTGLHNKAKGRGRRAPWGKLPDSLFQAAQTLAERDQVSVNRFVELAVAEKVSAMMTEDYLEQRAARGDRAKFENALAKVPSTPTNPEDAI
jgi:hypothetical protein